MSTNPLGLPFYVQKCHGEVKHALSVMDTDELDVDDVIAMADDECKALWKNLKLSHGHGVGNPLLRQEVASLHGVTKDEVLITTPQEGVYVGLHTMVEYLKRFYAEERVRVVTMFPSYESYNDILATLHCDVDFWMGQYDEDGGWKFTLEDLESIVQTGTRMLVVNFPHNPTGFVPSSDMAAELIEFCKSREIILFSDETYALSNNDGCEHLQSACVSYTNAVSLFGMSKVLALPGLQMGWLCTKNAQLMAMMQSFKEYLCACPPVPCEILALIALRNKEKIIERSMTTIQSNLKLLDEFTDDFKEVFEWYRPRASTAGFLRLKSWILGLVIGTGTEFCDLLLEDTGILLIPSPVLEFSDEYVRLGFASSKLPEVLNVLRKFLKDREPK